MLLCLVRRVIECRDRSSSAERPRRCSSSVSRVLSLERRKSARIRPFLLNLKRLPLTATNPPQRAYRPIAWIPGFSLGLDGTAGSAIGGEVVLPGVLGLAAGAIEPLAEALGEPGFEIGDDQAASTRAMTRSSSLGGVEKWVKRRTLARVRRRPKGCGRAESRPWANGRG